MIPKVPFFQRQHLMSLQNLSLGTYLVFCARTFTVISGYYSQEFESSDKSHLTSLSLFRFLGLGNRICINR